MIETAYDYDSGYHSGSYVEQDALAFLGVYKRIEDVPDMYRLSNFREDFDADEAWNEFSDDELSNHSKAVREDVYGGAYERLRAFCEERGVNPALADPVDIDDWLSDERDSQNATKKTTHDTRFRPIFNWYRWMTFSSDYPHRYQPTIMAVLLGGATYDIWKTRLQDRKNTPIK